MRYVSFLLLGCALVSGLHAAVQLAAPFSDHMVLQAGRTLPVWGTAEAGEPVTVEFAGQQQSTVADADGRWRVRLPALDYAPDHAAQMLAVRGCDSEVRLTDVMIGEVWLCSGQSNMRFTLGRRAEPRSADAPRLFPAALAGSASERIRLLNISGGTPADRRWAVCGPETAAEFSAIGYFFGAALARARDVPVGLIDLGRGGAAIRAFLPPEAFAARLDFDRAYAPEKRPAFRTGAVFENDLATLGPIGLRGVLWYQGEGDASRAALYPDLLRTMIAEWRRRLEAPELPFVIVQLPPWERRRKDPPRTSIGITWAELREAQRKVVETTPHTVLAVIADCGERLDIHPRRKREVGERLAQVARARVYGEPVPSSGPVLQSAEAGASSLVLTFTQVEGGLFARAEQLENFEIAGDDGRFRPATAAVTGYNQVTVTVPPGAGARYVRYAWRDYFEPSLLNGDGWPAAPFRTDDFPFTTAKVAATATSNPPPQQSLTELAREQFVFAARQYAGLLKRAEGEPGRAPYTFNQGRLKTVGPRDWTSGFFPGSLWLLYEQTGDSAWRVAAEDFTARLEAIKDYTGNHDLGFMLGCSYGEGWRLTRNPAYRDVLVQGARSLSTRFRPAVGLTRSWDVGSWRYPVIIDNMMNLGLLWFAYAETGDESFRDRVLSHADRTLANHFRPDGSSFHLVDYEPDTGAVLQRQTVQGFADASAWSRGQGWALAGYAAAARCTKNSAYLVQAQKVADFILHHPRLPADGIPYWDFDAPDIPAAPRDTAAAAVMSLGLLDLAELLGAEAGAPYRALAEKQLRSLAGREYRAPLGENGNFLLLHAVAHFPKQREVDVPLNYADYYFLKSLSRVLGAEASTVGVP